MDTDMQYPHAIRFACDSTLNETGELSEAEDCIRNQRDQLRTIVSFQCINNNPCPKCGGRVHWEMAETGAEAFCKCGWSSLDASENNQWVTPRRIINE